MINFQIMKEIIDILNDKYEFVGTSSKQEAHKKGLWHRVFTCILVNPKHKTILLQKKGSGRYAFNRPDYLDVRDWDYSLQITHVKYKN